MEEFKERQRAMWAAGDYATLSEHIKGVGEVVVARTGIQAGMDVLDVACGAGNAAIPAARAGARVTGLDLLPELLEGGRERAAAAGVEVDWVEGDAEDLSLDGRSFDRVFSTFGHMFAPRHRRTADEMMRVCREGGVIAICCWTPEGSVGDVSRASVSYLPPPPDFASPPILWERRSTSARCSAPRRPSSSSATPRRSSETRSRVSPTSSWTLSGRW
ncbi:MAG: class I SAM-dependent methyltransferase [Gaiellaceae bacterium]